LPLRYRNPVRKPSIFFITTTTHDRKPFPRYPECLGIIQKVLFDTISEKDMFLIGFVIMPTHLHLMVGSKNGGPSIARFMHALKGRIRIRLIRSGKLWQDRFDDLVIKSEEQFKIKLNYIHFNPVKGRLVENPQDWPYSSFIDWETGSPNRGISFDFERLF
jgi:putative transposase